jgi:hypothetical protein
MNKRPKQVGGKKIDWIILFICLACLIIGVNLVCVGVTRIPSNLTLTVIGISVLIPSWVIALLLTDNLTGGKKRPWD